MQLTVREASQADRQHLANLIHFEPYVHRHLDWRSPLDWLGHAPYLVAEARDRIVGALACPLDKPEIAWIRLFAVESTTPLGAAWRELWKASRDALEHLGMLRSAAIVMTGWFRNLLEASGFIQTDNVIVLRWDHGVSYPKSKNSVGSIRKMTPEDLETVCELDAIAFEEEWRNSAEALKLAYQQASIATVIEDGQGMLGFQISTSSMGGAHLARLAVHPAQQGRGIGYALVHNLLEQLNVRNITHVTVNTQEDNLASLALYARAGFTRTDEEYQVYQCYLS